MNKNLLLIFGLCLLPTLAQAQQKVYIQLNDTTIERYVWEVVDITFQNDNYKLESTAPSVDDAVDLGLSVKWAPINLTATTTMKWVAAARWKSRLSSVICLPLQTTQCQQNM